jgi:hypothetical protein
MPLEGTVAKLSDQRSIVVNIGSEDGVEESDVFEVYRLGDPVMDPDTGEEIGSIRYTKATVVPKEIMEEMTIMQSRETTRTDPLTPNIFTGTRKRKRLSNDSSVEANNSDVMRGDSVVRIEHDEEEQGEEDQEE